MKKKETWYDEEEDIIGIQVFEGDYWKSVELPNGVVIDVSKEGKILGIEISVARKVFYGETRKVLQKATA